MWIGRNSKSSTRKSYPWANCATTDICASKYCMLSQCGLGFVNGKITTLERDILSRSVRDSYGYICIIFSYIHKQMFLVRSKLPSTVQSYKCNSWASLQTTASTKQ